MICKAKGINSSYSILPSAFMSACDQLHSGRCNFGLEAVASSPHNSAWTSMKPGKIIDTIPAPNFKYPVDSTKLKPLVDQLYWFNVAFPYIEYRTIYRINILYHLIMLSSQLQTCRVNLASSSPWKRRAPRPGRAGFRPSGSRDAACSLDQSVFHAQRFRSQIGKRWQSLFDGKTRRYNIHENPLPYTMHPFMQSEQISEAGRISTTRLRC